MRRLAFSFSCYKKFYFRLVLALISQLVGHKSLAVRLEGEAEIILEEVVAILGVEVESMGIYFYFFLIGK